MARYEIKTTRSVQIEGHEGEVPGDTVIATIETEANLGSVWSLLQFGGAVAIDEAAADAEPKPAPKRKR